MQSALEMAGGNVGFTALFLTGLLALWSHKYKEKASTGSLFWYALFLLLLLITPIYHDLVTNYAPELHRDNMLYWLLPTAPVILYVGVQAIEYEKKGWNQVLLVLGMIALLLLAALTSYTHSDRQMATNASYIPEEELEIIQEIDKYRMEMHMDTVLLWGPNEIVQNARIYSGRIYTLYGKDLWNGTEDSQLHQIYEDWSYEAYDWMQKQVFHLEQIGQLAKSKGCDIVVLSRAPFDESHREIPNQLGAEYSLYYISDQYFIYAR